MSKFSINAQTERDVEMDSSTGSCFSVDRNIDEAGAGTKIPLETGDKAIYAEEGVSSGADSDPVPLPYSSF